MFVGVGVVRTRRQATVSGVWLKILTILDKVRRDNDMVKMFPTHMCGEVLFGLAEPSILRVLGELVVGTQGAN